MRISTSNLLKLIVCVLLSGMCHVQSARSQTNCAFALDEAQKSYEAGIFQNIPNLLLPCMKNGFSRDENLRAYKLLIMTYIFDDKQEKAEEVMLEFLDKYPEYKITPADPVEFKHLFEDYKTVPLYSFGIILGGNMTDAMITEPYGVSNLNKYNGHNRPAGMGIQAGIRVNRFLKERLELCSEILFSQNKFDYSASEYDFLKEISKNETFTNLTLPLTVIYDYPLLPFTAYVRGGVSFDYLLKSNALFKRTYMSYTGLTNVTGPELELTPNRNRFYLSLLVGGGVKYSISNGYLVFDLRANLGLLNFINSDNRYGSDNLEPNYRYWYIDDDIILNRMYVSVGYIRKLYKTYRNP